MKLRAVREKLADLADLNRQGHTQSLSAGLAEVLMVVQGLQADLGVLDDAINELEQHVGVWVS